MKAVWYVWQRGSGEPNYRHESRESAITEAKRLAGSRPGLTFDVVLITDSVTKTEMLHERVEITADIPF